MTIPADSQAPAAVVDTKASVWEDMIDIFYAPVSVFERRRDGRFGLALLVYTLLAFALLVASRPVMQPMFDAQMDAQVAAINERPGMSPQAREQATSMIRRMGDSPFALASYAIIIPIAVFVGGLALWVASKIVGSAQTLRQSMMIATYANYPRILIGLLMLALFHVAGVEGGASPFAQGLSPTKLISSDMPLLAQALLSRFELGAIWVALLMGIGTYVVGKVSKAQAAIVTLIVWAFATLFVLGSAAMQG